jgi:hypothetical protein
MAKIRITASTEFEIPDDLDKRYRWYGTRDLDECVDLEQRQFSEFPDLLAETFEDLTVTVEIVKD